MRLPTVLLADIIQEWREAGQLSIAEKDAVCLLALALFVRFDTLPEAHSLLLALMLNRVRLPPLALEVEMGLADVVASGPLRVVSALRACSIAETEVMRRRTSMAATVELFFKTLSAGRLLSSAAGVE